MSEMSRVRRTKAGHETGTVTEIVGEWVEVVGERTLTIALLRLRVCDEADRP